MTWQFISIEAAERTNRFRKSGAVAFGAEFHPLTYNPEIRRQQRLEERYVLGASHINSSKLSHKLLSHKLLSHELLSHKAALAKAAPVQVDHA
ncbi:hypothetical protein C172_03837 [Paenibacillus sp. FSL H8-457]|nr:hypothetical protein C172_03837 [Paenibacillus sp. FSL H8-457]